ncbi:MULTISPECIES: mannonate dehydratase [Mucilaginibacter]|uniref:mannonate dehydratase n=1 Tax=Mucilaginibacter TaxID=423349 RepID=UPI0001E9DFAC|nr:MULTISPECIES: mannonate dehydratase [Mucilaginibacter]
MFSNLEQTFRWFGPNDPVLSADIRQTGATGIVTALHHIPAGEVWGIEEIDLRKRTIAKAGLSWSVVESLNIHESKKTASIERDEYLAKYINSLKNLGKAGLKTVCYNFMPVLDWSRTNLDYRLTNNASALRYHAPAVAAFDLYILKREGAENDFTTQQKHEARAFLESITADEKTISPILLWPVTMYG